MTSTRLSLIVILLAFVNVNAGPCAEVRSSSPVVALGSPVSASCLISEDCPYPMATSVPIEWRLDDIVVPRSAVNQSGRISRVFIPSFNSTRAVLTCSVLTKTPQMVGMVLIRAGHLPSVPQHLHCQTNLTTLSKMSCSWDPGQDSLLPTNYSLHTYRRGKSNESYALPAGHHHITIPRSGFSLFSKMTIYVRAVNELGEAKSVPVVLEPVSVAKFEPPEILNIYADKCGCLTMHWKLFKIEWMDNRIFEVHVKATDSEQWRDQHKFEKRAQPHKPLDLCRLLNGTRYSTQMRVRYRQSPWSEWSRRHSAVTLESAPTGRLDSWMKVSRDHTHKQVSVDLFWKPSKHFRANGQNVSYVVSRTRLPGERGRLCATAGRFCSFQAPARAKVFLSAVNAAGRTTPIELRVYHNKDFSPITEMAVTSYDNTSLLVQWTSVDFGLVHGFVVVWRPLLNPDPAFVEFHSTNKTQSSFIISGRIEPYKPYGISVYPRFKDGMGPPQTADAFSRQKAPSMVPKLRVENPWYNNMELAWDEIPLEQRNGIIQGYEVHYWEESGFVSVVYAKPGERKISLKNLNPRSLYEAFLVVHTFGGSRNGTSIHFRPESFDMLLVVIVVFSVMGLILICMMIFLRYTSTRGSLKKHFWPIIPDPANSSIKKWSTESLEEILPPLNSKAPSLVYLSHLSFLDLPAKVQKEEEEEEKDDDSRWLSSSEDTSDLGESICGSPTLPGYCGSNSGSVPYATVVFSTTSSPPTSPEPRETHAYLRSESTQPLLEAEEASFTPKCYQNVPAETKTRGEQCFFGPSESGDIGEELEKDIVWDEFPFLSALAMNDSENDSM